MKWLTMEDLRMMSAQAVLRECFWSDYQMSAEELLKRLDENDPGFDRFVFSKIVENSAYPSRHLRVPFRPEKWQALLDRYLKTGRKTRRLRLMAANMTGNYGPGKGICMESVDYRVLYPTQDRVLAILSRISRPTKYVLSWDGTSPRMCLICIPCFAMRD